MALLDFFFKKYDIVTDGELYLRRYFIFRSKYFSIFLHKIILPDQGRDPHDHPWNFLGFVLKGGYLEARYDMLGKKHFERRNKWTWGYRRATDVHQIYQVDPGTWTLIFLGPRIREWGFWFYENARSIWVNHVTWLGIDPNDVDMD